MKNTNMKYPMMLLAFAFLFMKVDNQTKTEPWKPEQLMQPADLATIIIDSAAAKPLILNVGPVGSLRGAIKTGAVKEKEHLKNLKKLLAKEDRQKAIVIYCGCCPFKDCPNIRPAFSLLTKMKFSNHKLLNLPHNLKVDWIDQGYPMSN